MSTYRSRSTEVRRRFLDATDGGLIAQATVYQNAVKRELAGGFTSGDFVTGNLLNSVTRTDPRWEGLARAIRVGTNVMYAVFWELGHYNIFSRRYERVEIWFPKMSETAAAQRAAFARVFARIFGDGAAFDFEAAD
jgi:hypothetical protein